MKGEPLAAVLVSDRSNFVAPVVLPATRYCIAKRTFDIFVSLLLLLPLGVFALALVVVNPFLNKGTLLFWQDRMGKDCKPFRAVKFRSMVAIPTMVRGPFDPLEKDRITTLGRFLRKSRIDELPQIINVLRGEMSLIGPRPDALAHARIYLDEIPGYRERHLVRPGISGFAQVKVGYVDGLEGVRRKVSADIFYLSKASFRFDLWIAWQTLVVVALRKGA